MDGHVELREMRPGEPFAVEPFRVELIPLTHSIIEAGALALTTPLGTVIHTGDFKFDPTPTDQRVSDLHTLADYGRKGVLALFSDSTNVERPGMTPSERAVRERFAQIMAESRGRVLISCFATSLHRMQIVADLAQEHKRQLCFVGRSMFQNSEIAQQMGRLRVPEGLLVQPQDLRRLPPHQAAIVLAGSQGEPMSALSRVAVDSHRWVTVEPGDEVVIRRGSFLATKSRSSA
jgi:ribonuclease J